MWIRTANAILLTSGSITGNHIYLQRIQVEGGVIKPEDETLVHILSPEEDYEMDEYGKIVEGGVIIPHKGKYYMIYACGHYKGHYGEAYAVADNIFGPLPAL